MKMTTKELCNAVSERSSLTPTQVRAWIHSWVDSYCADDTYVIRNGTTNNMLDLNCVYKRAQQRYKESKIERGIVYAQKVRDALKQLLKES